MERYNPSPAASTRSRSAGVSTVLTDVTGSVGALRRGADCGVCMLCLVVVTQPHRIRNLDAKCRSHPRVIGGTRRVIERVADAGSYLARALAGMHHAGLVHGAVSTGRILRAANGDLQLGAFGLYPALVAAGVDRRDAAMLLSDVACVSPEGRAGAPLDPRSDVYSLGATMYELVTGKPPFGGRTTPYVVASVLSGDNGASAGANAQESSHVIDAVLRAIERAPEDRWPSAAAFATALEAGATSGADAGVEDGRSLRAIFKEVWFPDRRSRE